MGPIFCVHGTRAPDIATAKWCNHSDTCHQPPTVPPGAISLASMMPVAPTTPAEPPCEGDDCDHDAIEEDSGVVYVGTRERFVIKWDPDGEPTSNQLWKVGKVGGDQEYAKTLTKQGCSDYIDQCMYPEDYIGSRTLVTDVTVPVSTEPTLVPLDLLGLIPEGRFAVRPDATVPWTFLRLSRPKRGNFAGFLKIQTRHSDTHALAMTVSPKGEIRWYQSRRLIEPSLLILIADWHWAAICFTREIGACCRCGKSLTVEESLKYGIGPECVKYWPWIREEIEARADQ